MKYLSFYILILCILFPPIFYIFSVLSAENYLKGKYTSEIEEIYTGNTGPLFEGRVRLKDAIKKNIDEYLKNKTLLSYGVALTVTVTTKHQAILYPFFYEKEDDDLILPDPIKTAAANYNLLKEGLLVAIELELKPNTLITNIILFFYIFISILVLYFYYNAGLKKAGLEDRKKTMEMKRLLALEAKSAGTLNTLNQERQKLSFDLRQIKKAHEAEKKKVDINENEMIEEIESLEKKISTKIFLEKKQQEEIDLLTEKINTIETSRQKTKASKSIHKRLNTLYKNISITDRALNGFLNLTDDMRIKSEEIIHQLNNEPSLVAIKRKVFGRKSKKTVFEVIFSYNGRFYFQKLKDNKIKILAIGTKNTQAKDLELIDKL